MGKIQKEQAKQRNGNRHAFLLTFFDKPDRYSYKEVNGFILVRQFNAPMNKWEVAIYPKANWTASQEWKNKQKK